MGAVPVTQGTAPGPGLLKVYQTGSAGGSARPAGRPAALIGGGCKAVAGHVVGVSAPLHASYSRRVLPLTGLGIWPTCCAVNQAFARIRTFLCSRRLRAGRITGVTGCNCRLVPKNERQPPAKPRRLQRAWVGRDRFDLNVLRAARHNGLDAESVGRLVG